MIISWVENFRPPNAHETHISKTLFSYKIFATTIAETYHRRNVLDPSKITSEGTNAEFLRS